MVDGPLLASDYKVELSRVLSRVAACIAVDECLDDESSPCLADSNRRRDE